MFTGYSEILTEIMEGEVHVNHYVTCATNLSSVSDSYSTTGQGYSDLSSFISAGRIVSFLPL